MTTSQMRSAQIACQRASGAGAWKTLETTALIAPRGAAALQPPRAVDCDKPIDERTGMGALTAEWGCSAALGER
jgi:hypothetical protein